MPAARSRAGFADCAVRLAALLAALLLALPACGGRGGAETPSELTGLITRLERDGGRISALRLETTDGTYEIRIAREVDYGFDLNHLEQHRAQSLPVRCELEERDGDLVALEIVDA